MHLAIIVEQRAAITLWCLATCAEYWTIGHLFGVAGTPFVALYTTHTAIVNVLQSQYVQFPIEDQLSSTLRDFRGSPTCHTVLEQLMDHIFQ